MKVLFLDIDGVINSTRTCRAYKGFPQDLNEKDLAMFDPVAIQLIRKLCEETNTSIVLSSTWRYYHTAHEIANAFDLPVIDCTPQLDASRGVEIQTWLSEHPEVTKYAIVDDIQQFLPEQQQYFVQTDDEFGLSLRNYYDLYNILKGDE